MAPLLLDDATLASAGITLDPAALRRAWGGSPMVLRHSLGGHPSLSVAELAELAGELPPERVEHHLADLPLLLPRGDAVRLRASGRDVALDLERNGCWVMLTLERTPSFAAVLDDVRATIGPAVTGHDDALDGGRATILLGSPRAVVPVHFDRHHNVLLQITGAKTVAIGSYCDPTAAQLEIERNFAPDSQNAHRMPDSVTTFELTPGDALYIPPYAFHWVTGGPTVSVSLSCSYHTPATVRRQLVHQCNAGLRRLGMRPRPPGGSIVPDRAKVALLATVNRLRGRVERRHPGNRHTHPADEEASQ